MSDKFQILFPNGNNINLFRTCEQKKHSKTTLAKIINKSENQATSPGSTLHHLQFHTEYLLIIRIHQASRKIDCVLINPTALANTRVALHDTFRAMHISFIENHLSNVHVCKPFYSCSCFLGVVVIVIFGLYVSSYSFALQTAVNYLSNID